jgi:cyclic pyranopterin monophosphate synthase
MKELTHFNRRGEARMVDVSAKESTHRIAVAEGRIMMRPETLELVRAGGHKKGDVLGIARVAGIMGAKRTAELVPLCHPLSLTAIEVELKPESNMTAVHCRACAETFARTGVEMEALTAVQIALLTVYDMCKAVDRAMALQDIRLVRKSGGTSGDWLRE